MYKYFFKRLFDIFIGLLGFPFFLIAFLVFAPIIKLTDKGSVFYNAERIGRNGKLFKMYKFRSMYVNSPDIRLTDGSTFNGEDDPRETKIGKFIRATSIDELPQILNILNGTMSLIGPRPDPPDWLDKYPEEIRVFLTVRPGLTGYSQAYYRNSADGEQQMKKLMLKRGIHQNVIDTIGLCGIDLDHWLEGFHDTEDSVRNTINTIRTHPLVPKDVNLHGYIIDSQTGKLTEVK